MQLNLKTLNATLHYEETGEEEKANLGNLVKDGDLAISAIHFLKWPISMSGSFCPVPMAMTNTLSINFPSVF
jgi:hypothetical protein